MIDDVSDIAEMYGSISQEEHSRLERHQLEHDLTWRYLDRYLPRRGAILEVGAATGRYTLELARRGYTLTAVDLSPALLEQCRENLASHGLEKRVRLVLADARALHRATKKRFDAVLLMGPLYHLVVKADRQLALKEAWERLQPGGILISSWISRYGILSDLIKEVPQWIEDQAKVRSTIERGKRPDGYPRGGFRAYFAKVSEIAPLHERAGFETLVVAGVEPVIAAGDESYNRLQGEQRQRWLDLLFEVSTEKSIIGASRHLLYIGRKTK